LSFDLGSRDGIKQTIAKVNQHIRQVQTSLEEAKAFHGELNSQMRTVQSQSKQLSAADVNAKLDGFMATSGQFSSTFQALNAQANVRRHTVVALLK
jgi:methyl-accepting chemotaxis protein